MIEKIELDNPEDFRCLYSYHDEIAKKINELIDVVNKLDVRLQKIPQYVNAIGKYHE